MIQSHLYTNKPQTILYTDRSVTSSSVCVLNQGNWVGVLEAGDDWFRVLSIKGEGWVRAEDVEERSPFNLHVQWTPGQPIQYVSAA
ncbi:MAG: hypothetical protein ABIQ11_08210 [Saprospiraceae bacterium]